MEICFSWKTRHGVNCVDSIAVSLFGNIQLKQEKYSSLPKSMRTKDPNYHSDTETGTLSKTVQKSKGRMIPGGFFTGPPKKTTKWLILGNSDT